MPVLKINMDGDVRRLRGYETSSVDKIQELISSMYQMKISDVKKMTMKYKDDEGDYCTLVDETFPDALRQAGLKKVFFLDMQHDHRDDHNWAYKRACRGWQAGYCAYGDWCRFTHA